MAMRRVVATLTACLGLAWFIAHGVVDRRRRRRHGLQFSLEMPAATSADQDDANGASSSPRRSHGIPLAVHVMPTDASACSRKLLEVLSQKMLGDTFLGLDCEWQPETQPGQQHKIAVIQLSNATDCIILRPLLTTHHGGRGGLELGLTATCARPGPDAGLAGLWRRDVTDGEAEAMRFQDGYFLIPQEFRALLEDPCVIKAGVGIQEDVKRLRRDFGINTQVRGCYITAASIGSLPSLPPFLSHALSLNLQIKCFVQGALDIRLAVQMLAPHYLRGAAAGGSSLQALALSMLGMNADKSLQCSPWHHRTLSLVSKK